LESRFGTHVTYCSVSTGWDRELSLRFRLHSALIAHLADEDAQNRGHFG
jgi:hypothetical protein